MLPMTDQELFEYLLHDCLSSIDNLVRFHREREVTAHGLTFEINEAASNLQKMGYAEICKGVTDNARLRAEKHNS